MVRTVDSNYLVDLVDQCYRNQEENCFFCYKTNCEVCNATFNIQEELRKNSFNSDINRVVFWEIFILNLLFIYLYFQTKITTEIKYTVANNSHQAKEPKQATVGSAGHGLIFW